MLKNKDLNAEIRAIIAEQHWNLTALADRMGTYDSNLHRLLKQDHVQENFIKLCDALGYDVEVKLVRKRGRYGKEEPPSGLEKLSKKEARDLIEKLQSIIDAKS